MANVSVWPEWEIVEKIGEGSFGQVYKIRKNSQGREEIAALKVITIPKDDSEIKGMIANGMDEQTIGAYFKSVANDLFNEIKIMESLRSATNIVTLQESLLQQNSSYSYTLYIRMELLKPMELYLQNGRMPLEEAVKLGIDICSAISSCEKIHIIHRDIKPQNIFMNEFGDYKLGDFGIAKQLERTGSLYSHKGTSMYMAPEVVSGVRYDHTVDIYSLGIMLYRFFNHGRAPFFPPYPNPITPADIEVAATRKNNGDTMPDPSEADEELSRIILKACSFNPAERYRSAQEMKDDLLSWKVLHGKRPADAKPDAELPSEKTEVLTDSTRMQFDSDSQKTVAVHKAPYSEGVQKTPSHTEELKAGTMPQREIDVQPVVPAAKGELQPTEVLIPKTAPQRLQGNDTVVLNSNTHVSVSNTSKPAAEPKQKMNKGLIIGLTAVLSAVLAGVFLLNRGGSKNIDLDEYVQLAIAGVDGYAEAEAVVDINKINRAYGTRLSPEDVELEIYPYENLSNGEEVTVTLSIDENAAKTNHIQQNTFEYSYKVEDLKEPELVNVFDEVIIVTFSGENGSGTVSAVSGSTDPFLKNVTYRCEPDSGLSNGDVIMVYAVVDPEIMEQYGKAPEFSEKDATVVSLDNYVADIDEMTEQAYGDLYNKCVDSVKNTLMFDPSKYMQAAGVTGVKNISITNVWTSRTYFITPTERNVGNSEFKNRIVMIMHVQGSDSKKAKRYFYFPVIFDDVMMGYDSVLGYTDKTDSLKSWKYAGTNIQSIYRALVAPYEANYSISQDIKE